MKKHKPEEVFTPKGKSVNDDMYIERTELELAFRKAIRKQKHIIIYGESGSGKTWLYKKIFSDEKTYYAVLNSATINGAKSLSAAMQQLCASISPQVKTGYDEKTSAEANALFAKGGADHTNKYSIKPIDPYLELLTAINKKSKNKESFLVIDNLEHIIKNPELLKELSSILLYLDDENYANKKVRILLVGTLSNIRDYFSSIDESQTLVNRIQELPEVSALPAPQVEFLANKGLFTLLDLKLAYDSDFPKGSLFNFIKWYSINIPQYVHELCLEIAICAEQNNNRISKTLCLEALKNWLREALVSESARIEKNINSKETRHGRRNQVIYSIGFLKNFEFSTGEIEETLRSKFPTSTLDKVINVPAILSELSKGTHPIIRRTPNGTRYRVWDPKIRIMIRWMIQRNDVSEEISVKKLDDTVKI